MKYLGLDLGERRIGVALSQGSLAFPQGVLEGKGEGWEVKAIVELVRAEGVERVIVGLPLSLNGTLGPQAQRVLALVDALRQASPVPVETWDERFSTTEAERLLTEAGHRWPSRKAHRDALAAALVLQAYLDHQRASSG